MALVLKDRVKETTTTTGTGTYTLAGAEDGFQAFSAIGDGNITYYTATNAAGDWEVGIGTYTASGTTLARTTILSSSNGGSAVDWSAGEKQVFVTQPASKASYVDENGFHIGNVFEKCVELKTTVANKPAYEEGRLFYDKAFGALAFYNDESDITLQIGQEDYIRVYNDTGATISNGTPVYLTGESGATPTVSVARADSTPEEAQAVGLATHDIENNTIGYVTVRGLIADVDTSHLTVGAPVHVAVGGGTVTESPSYPYYPTEIGVCLISSATEGCIYVSISHETFQTLRVDGNSHFDADVTIDGDLVVNGTQTITSSNNIALSGAFSYFNSGDTISDITFTGTGNDDMLFTGHYNGTSSNKTFYVRISDHSGSPDKFEWSLDNFATIEATDIAITEDDQLLEDGISVKFNSDNGHHSLDTWSGTASPVNVDTGIASNRNTGTSGVGYTHIGMYYDVSSNYWTFFDEYAPEPTGTIDTSHASFSYGDIKVNSVIGNVVGDLTGIASSATQLANNRNITLSGDVTGTAVFNGGADANITATVVNDSHTHDTRYVQLAGDTMSGTLNVPTVDFGDWTITESGGSLYFAYQGTNKLKLDTSGTLSVTNDVQTDQTI